MLIPFLLSHVHSRKASPLEAGTRSQAQNASHAPSFVSHGAAASGSDSTNQTGSSAAITANDFLTLLVTEIQNQDPTSQTDPMQYITQLVGVNSLQQLLQINQTLTSAVGPGGTFAGGNPSASSAPRASSSTTENSVTKNSVTGNSTGANATSHSDINKPPLAANGQATSASTNAVAQALTQPTVMPQQILPPTQVPLNPEVLRALEHSIPGAKLVGPPSTRQ